jgi:hypothetical protein
MAWRRARRRAATIAVSALLASIGCSTTMKSEVKGSRSPKTVSCSLGERAEVENGGFTILQKCVFSENLIVGDGRSEATVWSFDFSEDKHLDGCIIQAAMLELRLEPMTETLDEELRVQGKWDLGLVQLQNIGPGAVHTIEIDVLSRNGGRSPYTPRVLRSLILEEPYGQLPMVYELNAIVSQAKLTIGCS